MISKLYHNKFFRETVYYGLATAVNRGLTLLALPFLGNSLTIEDFGIWTLSQILISLGFTFFSLNGSSAILREGAADKRMGFILFRKFVGLTAQLSVIVLLVSFFLEKNWIFYTVLLILLESFLSLLTSWYRAQDKHLLYLLAVLTKVFSLVISILLTRDAASLNQILKLQVIFGVILLIPFFITVYATNKTLRGPINFKPILLFCITLIPHGLSQWILSGSDRMIIKHFLGDTSLGLYSLAYTLCMTVMLINSGLGMTVPVDFIKNYDKWKDTKLRNKMIAGYSILFLVASTCLVGFSVVFKPQLPFLKNLTSDVLALMPWILNGMYFLGIYLFYINYLFYLRKSIVVSLITLSAAIFNVLLTILLVLLIGVKGAAVSTFFSYMLYMILSTIMAIKNEKLPGNFVLIDYIIIATTVIINYLAISFLTTLQPFI